MTALSYFTVADLCDHKLGTRDVACPLCGPSRSSPVNRKRRVLRIWHEEPGFATFACARCGEKGWARGDGVQMPKLENVVERIIKTGALDDHAERQHAKAKWLWSHGKPVQGSLAEVYLRQVRGYCGLLPPSLRFLEPLKRGHHPAMMAAFAVLDEVEPGILSIRENQINGIHLTLLAANGRDKARTGRDKLMIGSSLGAPIVLAPMTDSHGLVIAEGIEDSLTLHEATGLPIWAAGSASRLVALADAVPSFIDCVTIAADNDQDGRAGALKLAHSLRARGLHVEVSLPAAAKAAA